ncbi:hypothetical protein GGI19_005235 [Coemansia pectinata]|uniref:Histone chaperone domain-containing protein n=1 Tax=Coemansia pectinata TaxID=1052879 RepID=A0A9W8GU46_9FUNG|nr:hypothetical protein GGI19_005235 [Coemansia pectinata]
MPTVDITKLKEVCAQLVSEGDLDELTDRSVRRSAEQILGLDENTLEEKVYKKVAKETVAEAIARIKSKQDESSAAQSDEEDVKDADESEVSELDDDDVPVPTSAAQKKRTLATSKSPQTAKRAKKDDSGGKLSKSSETTITNLKQYITKCGLRKVWAKELAGLSGAQQIQHLKDILSELGMEGRPTLEKCKKIKAKRDLLAELEEIGGGDDEPDLAPVSSGRSRRGGSTKVVQDDDSDEEHSEVVAPGMEVEEKAAKETDLLDHGSDAAPEEEDEDEDEDSEESDAYSEGGSESDDGAQSEKDDEEESGDDEPDADSD